MRKPALLIIDMLNDFVTGPLACERGKAIVPAVVELAQAARLAGVPVVFCNDAHVRGIDRELAIWGDHAIAGTPGAEVIADLGPCEGDFVVPKRRYSGFFQTDLDILLRELGVDTVVVAGLHAHMCVRHTSADAYCLGYDVAAAAEATDSFTEEECRQGLAYLKTCYGADAYSNDELIEAFGLCGAALRNGAGDSGSEALSALASQDKVVVRDCPGRAADPMTFAVIERLGEQ